jgi:hypothetical protein
MIHSDRELHVMLERIATFQQQLEHLRRAETNPTNYRLSAGGFLAELDRMNLEVREYLASHPGEDAGEPTASVGTAG